MIPVKQQLRNIWSHLNAFVQIVSWHAILNWIRIGFHHAATTGVVWLFAPGFTDSSQDRAKKTFITHMHLSYLNAQFYTFMQIVSWRPYLIESENCSICSNYRCCMIACTTLHWFQSSHSWETFDHIHASLIPECTVLHFYANCFMGAILDQIRKLFKEQLQVLCDCLC